MAENAETFVGLKSRTGLEKNSEADEAILRLIAALYAV